MPDRPEPPPAPFPPEVIARTKEFYERLGRYTDVERLDLSTLPFKWPTTFNPKVKGKRLGLMTMDWGAVLYVLTQTAFVLALPEGVSDEELTRMYESFKQRTTEEEKMEVLKRFAIPAMETIGYVVEHLPEKIDTAIQMLMAEGRYARATIDAKEQNTKLTESVTQFVNIVNRQEARAIRTRLKRYSEKGRRGQFSKWTSETFSEALKQAAISLKNKDNEKPLDQRLQHLDYSTIHRELQLLYPDTAPKSSETLRKLIARLNLSGEWAQLQAAWDALAATPTPPDTGK